MGVLGGIGNLIKVTAALVFLVIVGAIIAAAVKVSDEGGIHRSVADDMIQQYEMAKRNGSKMDVCVRAGLVAESFLQGKDEASYKQWKTTERADCARAGLNK